ncbi:hypothetical protein EGYY_20480 [Eggerthella sp. YY7918]|nr:hypothetical protein EGYY_20480 [Eggerthella sp. YY7918]
MIFAYSVGLTSETKAKDEFALPPDKVKGSEYVLSDSDSRLYTREELEALSSQDRYLAINEIYARHGRGFNNEDLAAHFEACSWYKKLYSPEEFDNLPTQLNEFEQMNVDTLRQIGNEQSD